MNLSNIVASPKIIKVGVLLMLLMALSSCIQPLEKTMTINNNEPEVQVDNSVASNDDKAISGPNGDDVTSIDGVIAIQGIFDPEGKELLRLEPIRRYSWIWEESPFEPEGYFVMEVKEVSGNVTKIEFDALVASDSDFEVVRHGFFEVFAPVKGDILSIRITDASGEKVFANINGAEVPPAAVDTP